MVIDINQQKLSSKDSFRIFLNQQETYYATSLDNSWLTHLELFSLGNDLPSVQIKQKWAWLKTKFTLTFEGGSEVLFSAKSVWSRHFQCYVGGSAYDIYGHERHKVSVYKDGQQIAWWSKEAVSWFNGDNYRLLADDGSDYEALIAFCLILVKIENKSRVGRFHFDFKHFGPQIKAFNLNWKPKIK